MPVRGARAQSVSAAGGPTAQTVRDAVGKWALRLLRQPSTWRGLVLLATAAGLTLSDIQAEAVIAAGLALAGAIGTFTDG